MVIQLLLLIRMVNGGGSHVMIIQLSTLDGSPVDEDDCKVLEIANDGIYLTHGIKPRFGKTVLPPGGRADWIIRCNQPQEYEVCVFWFIFESRIEVKVYDSKISNYNSMLKKVF